MLLYSDIIRRDYNLLAIFFDHLVKLGLTDKQMKEVGEELRRDLAEDIFLLIEDLVEIPEKKDLDSTDRNKVKAAIDKMIDAAKHDDNIMNEIREYIHDVLLKLDQETGLFVV